GYHFERGLSACPQRPEALSACDAPVTPSYAAGKEPPNTTLAARADQGASGHRIAQADTAAQAPHQECCLIFLSATGLSGLTMTSRIEVAIFGGPRARERAIIFADRHYDGYEEVRF